MREWILFSTFWELFWMLIDSGGSLHVDVCVRACLFHTWLSLTFTWLEHFLYLPLPATCNKRRKNNFKHSQPLEYTPTLCQSFLHLYTLCFIVFPCYYKCVISDYSRASAYVWKMLDLFTLYNVCLCTRSFFICSLGFSDLVRTRELCKYHVAIMIIIIHDVVHD